MIICINLGFFVMKNDLALWVFSTGTYLYFQEFIIVAVVGQHTVGVYH